MKYNIGFTLGDPGGDGHACTTDYHIVANHSAAEIQLISKMCKKLEDSISSFIEAGREDLATEYRDELEVLKKLLPEPVNEPDIHSALQIWCEGKGFIEDFYNEENSIDMVSFQIPKKEMGNAIKYLKSEFPQADGKMISEIVKKYIV